MSKNKIERQVTPGPVVIDPSVSPNPGKLAGLFRYLRVHFRVSIAIAVLAQLAKQPGVNVYAPTGTMVFSSDSQKPTGAKIHPSTGSTYMVHDGASQWRAFGL